MREAPSSTNVWRSGRETIQIVPCELDYLSGRSSAQRGDLDHEQLAKQHCATRWGIGYTKNGFLLDRQSFRVIRSESEQVRTKDNQVRGFIGILPLHIRFTALHSAAEIVSAAFFAPIQ